MIAFRPAALLLACLPLAAVTPVRAADEPAVKPSASPEATAIQSALVGTWRLEKREGKMWSSEINTYKADGTFTSRISYEAGKGPQKVDVEGKWSVDGHRISYEITKSSDTKATPVGTKSTDTIAAVDSKQFRYLTDIGAEELEVRTTDTEPKEPDAKLGFTIDKISLYQPDDLIGKRIDVKDLSQFLKAASAECVHYFGAAGVPENLNVVIALRPGKRSKVWLEPANAGHPERAALIKRLEAIPVMEIKEGPVAVAVIGAIGGGVPKPADAPPLPVPQEWKDASATEKAAIGLDELLQKIWP